MEDFILKFIDITTVRANVAAEQAANEPLVGRQAVAAERARTEDARAQLRAEEARRPRVLVAKQALEVPMGSCVAVKLVPAVEERRQPTLFVRLIPAAYLSSANQPRWVPAAQVLTEDEATRWVANGF